jgi:hypothetical protein
MRKIPQKTITLKGTSFTASGHSASMVSILATIEISQKESPIAVPSKILIF